MMSDKRLETAKNHTKSVIGDTPERQKCVDELAELWERMKAEGLDVWDFSHALHDFSFSMMFAYANLDDAMIFSKMVRDSGENSRKILSEEWPPPDPDGWQWRPSYKDDDG